MKHVQNKSVLKWIVMLRLYKIWPFTSHVSTELFTDCFNESGVLNEFCSSEEKDVKFGAIERWEHVEKGLEGGTGRPPFERGLINKMLNRSRRGFNMIAHIVA